MTGSESEWPMTFALGAPQRGQTIPEVDRLAIKVHSSQVPYFLDVLCAEKMHGMNYPV